MRTRDLTVQGIRHRVFGLAWAVVVLTGSPAWSQEAATSSPESSVEDPSPVSFDGRPTFRIGQSTQFDLRLKTQTDWRDFAGEASTASRDPFDVHRARVAVTGTVLSRIDFQVERELRDDTNPWRDLFVDVRIVRDLQVQGGQFKMPFGLDQLTGGMDLDFMYRSLAGTYLTPGRDVGVMVRGRWLGDRIRHEVGVFRRGGDNLRASERTDVRTAPTLAGRTVFKPWATRDTRSPLRSVAVGVAITDGELPDGLNSVRGKTVPGDPFFQPFYVAGRRHRIGLETQWRVGPAGVQGEFIRTRDDRKGQGIADEDLPELVARGWYLSGTWLLTGERKKDTVKPARPISRHGVGALEIAGRFERLVLGHGTAAAAYFGPRSAVVPARTDDVWTTGVNWYLNTFIRLQANVMRERRNLGDGSASGRVVQWSRTLRFQFGF